MPFHRIAHSIKASRLQIISHSNARSRHFHPVRRTVASSTVRHFSSKTVADEKIEEIQDLYATAKDELDIAVEETEKQTVYAEEDRKAAREELDRVQDAFKAATEGPDRELADQIKQRIGQRIRELDSGVKAVEEMAKNQD